MSGYIWSLLALLFVSAVSASSGLLSAGLFEEKWRFWIYGISGLAPIVSMLLVGFKVAGAGPFSIFIDPVACIAWVACVNVLFTMLPKMGWATYFYVWLLAIALGVVVIRLFAGNVWS